MGLEVIAYIVRKDDPSRRYVLDWACGRNDANEGLMELARDRVAEDGTAEYFSLVFDPEMDGRTLAESSEDGKRWREKAVLASTGDIERILDGRLREDVESCRKAIGEARERIAFDRAKMAYASFDDVERLREDARTEGKYAEELEERLAELEGQRRFVSNIAFLAKESMSEHSPWKDCFLLVSFSY